MKRIAVVALISWCFLISIYCVISHTESALAQSSENYIISVKSNNAWIINKTNRKMILIKYEDEDVVWKSEKVTVPDNFNLNRCTLEVVGKTGRFAFLYDQSSGLMTFFQAKKDHSILQYLTIDLQTELK